MILRNYFQISQQKGKEKCPGHVSVFCQNLGITAYTLENFENKFLSDNGSILELNDYYNKGSGEM